MDARVAISCCSRSRFLVGLERESTKIEEQKMVFGGVRTHPIISLLGSAAPWFYTRLARCLCCRSLVVHRRTDRRLRYIAKIKVERYGSTSEISALLTFRHWRPRSSRRRVDRNGDRRRQHHLLSEKAALESYVERLNKVEFLATINSFLLLSSFSLFFRTRNTLRSSSTRQAFGKNCHPRLHDRFCRLLPFEKNLAKRSACGCLERWVALSRAPRLTLAVGRIARKGSQRAEERCKRRFLRGAS